MTLADGKRKVLMLLDEYSSGGEITTDIDINNKMADFFDMAQKDMAQSQPIIKKMTMTLTGLAEYYATPSGYIKTFRTWKDGARRKNYPVIDKMFYVNYEEGDVIVEYMKTPTTINNSTLDSYEFEVNEEAANCLPFYVASQQIITDLVVDYSALWNIYLMMKNNLPSNLPEDGGMSVRQRLFG